jgi:hypothetical protein
MPVKLRPHHDPLMGFTLICLPGLGESIILPFPR